MSTDVHGAPDDGTDAPDHDGLGRAGVHDRPSLLSRALYALFSGHADSARHDADRTAYRGTDLRASFGSYLARVYATSWVVAVVAFLAAFGVGLALPPATLAGVVAFVRKGLPLVDGTGLPGVPRPLAAGMVAVLVGTAAKRGTVWFGGRYLRWRAAARRANIDHTLPSAVRYLRALSTGADDRRAMLRKVADTPEAYGETAVSFRKALNKASLTGSLDEGLRIVARDTPSREALAPFLLKFREHARQGSDALTSYLRMESRMLSHRQERARKQAEGFLELLAELFIVLLVLPALFVIVLTVMSVLAPGLGAPVETPVGTTTGRGLAVYASAGFVLIVGGLAAVLVEELRPPAQSVPAYERPRGHATVRSALRNPASARVVFAVPAVAVAALAWEASGDPVDTVLAGYVAYALPVGLVAVRRARLDDAKDREFKYFVHAVSGHVGLGRPFSAAVTHVAREVDLGALSPDVEDLAFNASLTTREGDLRAAALDRFVERVGTPLAEQTMGLVTGALAAGSDSEDVFDTLQTEVGRLHHQKKALRSAMLVYVAVGWTTALLIVGIVVAVNTYVLDGFAQLATVTTPETSVALDPTAVDPAVERERFYVVTQATMVACGWFAGMASRGRYEALLHSGLLVALAAFVFAGVGLA